MNIIIEPKVTEKSVNLAGINKYVFKVSKNTTKNEIEKEVEKIFKVKVTAVNILYNQAKEKKRGRIIGHTSKYKKAIVTLKKGDTIKALEVKK